MLEPAFLFALFGTNDDGDLALLSKPKIGSRYVTDFALLKFGQGGCVVDLVEIENSERRLFNNAGRPCKELVHAIGQLDEWKAYIDKNARTFVRDLVSRAKDLPSFGLGKTSKQGFRMKSSKDIEQLWHAFEGFDMPSFRYSVVIGRWANLDEAHRKKLIGYNRKYADLHSVWTFDQLARQALVRPNRDEE